GSAEDHLEIARHLQGLPPLSTEVIPLGTLPAARTAETLRAMFGGAGGPFLEADPTRNAIVVRGTGEQIQQLKAALGPLGETPATGNVRIIPLERGSASAVAE